MHLFHSVLRCAIALQAYDVNLLFLAHAIDPAESLLLCRAILPHLQEDGPIRAGYCERLAATHEKYDRGRILRH